VSKLRFKLFKSKKACFYANVVVKTLDFSEENLKSLRVLCAIHILEIFPSLGITTEVWDQFLGRIKRRDGHTC